MSEELKIVFHESLLASLSNVNSQLVMLKKVKSGFKISSLTSKKQVGEIYFEYLRNAGGVYVGCHVDGGRMHEALAQVCVGWKSNLLNSSCLYFNSLSEKRHEFSGSVGGVVTLYSGMDVQKTTQEIANRVMQFHLKKIENLVSVSPALIDDVQQNPDHYSHPIAIAAICCQSLAIPDRDAIIEKMVADKRFGKVALGELNQRVAMLAL